MIRFPRRFDTYAVLAAILVAAEHVFGVMWRNAKLGIGVPAYDTYAYSYPNFVYARDALQRGYGLLWNDFQNCGQPFFGIITTALLYPVNALFYFLCREIGLTPVAAFSGALAFQLGGICVQLAS